jgi:hypothetical protein
VRLRATSIIATTVITLAGAAHAKVCDYTPSNLVGKTTTAVGTALAGGSAAVGVGMQAMGYYTLVHAGSGLTMLGSTALGASAAGTIGIMAGTGGTIGTIGAIVMAPLTLIVGGVAIVGVGSFEGLCYFQVERITDPYEVRKIIESVASEDAAVSIVPTDDGDAMALKVLGKTETYLLRNLYIADGQLMHRDYGPNTNLGPIFYTSDVIEK